METGVPPSNREQIVSLAQSLQAANARSEALENQVRALGEAMQALLGRLPTAMEGVATPTPLFSGGGAPHVASSGVVDPSTLRMLEKATYGSHPKLHSTYDNSPEWQTRFVQAATTYGLLGVFVTDPEGQTYPDAIHRASMNLLCESIDTNVLMALKTSVITRGESWEAARPRGLYVHLLHQWNSKMHDRTFELKTQLIQFELYAGESITSYFDRLQDLWVKLTACGSPPGVESLLDAAVRGMNKHAVYDPVCMQIKSGLEWPTMNMTKGQVHVGAARDKIGGQSDPRASSTKPRECHPYPRCALIPCCGHSSPSPTPS
jgi:hypothetical protein